MCLQYKPFEKVWEKEKFLLQAISPFPTVISAPFGEPSAIFIKSKIVVCKFFQFGRVQNL